MGKKKGKGEYNDYLEDTRYSNNDTRTTAQATSTVTRTVSPPLSKSPSQHRSNTNTNRSKSKKPPLTHFLCLPLVTSTNRTHLSTALEKLKGDVEELTLVPRKAVRPVGTLHLTLGVMSLSSAQLEEASQYLAALDLRQLLRGITTQTVAEEARDTPAVSENFGAVANPQSALHSSPALLAANADPDQLVVRLSALLPMQKPTQTSILYAEPRDETARLIKFAQSVKDGFEERGLLVKDERALRLHATVVNTIYAKPKGQGRGKGKSVSRPAGGEDVTRQDGPGGGGDGADGVAQQSDEGGVDEAETKSRAHGLDAKSWMRFDATSLIEAYKDFVWADDVRIDRVQICKMGAQKMLHEATGEVVDEKYEVVAEKSI